RRVLDPFLRVGSFGRVREERAQVLGRAVRIAALEQQEREPVVRARELAVELQRAAIVPDRFVDAPRLGERDRHVLENARVVGMVAQRQAIRCEGRVVVALAFECERLVEIVEALGVDLVGARAAEQAAPETHGPKIACGLATVQCSFTAHACPAPAPAPAPAPYAPVPPAPPGAPARGPARPPPGAAWRPRGGLAGLRRDVPGAGFQKLPGLRLGRG